MKFTGICTVLASVMLSPSLQAAVTVQTQIEESQRPFDFFDARLGTLNSVTARYSVAGFPIDINLFSNSSGPVTVDYSLNVPFGTSFAVDNVVRGNGASSFVVSAVGNQQVDLRPQNNGTFTQFGSLRFNVSGFLDSSLDPNLFIARADGFRFNFFDIIPRDVTGTINTSRGDVRAVAFPAFGSPSGSVRLTYDFTPFASAVPEPDAWAMMLLGFGGIGYSMRRKSKLTFSGANAVKM